MKTAISMNEKALVSSRGQVVIPSLIRKKFGIHAGTELVFETRSEGVMTVKSVQRTIELFFGCCKGEKSTVLPVQPIDKAIMRAVLENDTATRKTSRTKT